MPLVVIVPMLLCVTSQQIIAQRLRVRQQAIPLVAQVHGRESRTTKESVPTDLGLPETVVAKAIPARHLAASKGAHSIELHCWHCVVDHTELAQGDDSVVPGHQDLITDRKGVATAGDSEG
ncbi:hypothetical protein GCM10009745_06240 [Kribbella yunnanensis]|uniref:Secreted protein n=1 Tax=Kribbella yunnanensis TaxID=190194 RepID=A0ABN2G7P6_9ACTN